MADEKRMCVAPACGEATPSKWHSICDACRDRVESAMLRARPSLIEVMARERAEVDLWLASDWEPARRWGIAGREYYERPVVEVVKRMVDETCSEWDDPSLAFFDDSEHQQREKRREHVSPESEPRRQTGWLVPSESGTAEAWRAHLTPLISAALTEALATFPLAHAGREIRAALLGGYGEDQTSGAFEEIWEGTGGSGLSEDAETYLEVLHYPQPNWICNVGPDGIGAELWRKHRVLSDDIMAILTAVDAAEPQARGAGVVG